MYSVDLVDISLTICTAPKIVSEYDQEYHNHKPQPGNILNIKISC